MATESDAYIPTYADIFPELPASTKVETVIPIAALVKPRTITEVFSVPIEEQRYRNLDENVFGSAAEQARICSEICRETDTKIEMNIAKDKTLSVCITGKRDNVKNARKILLQKLQKQASFDLAVPKGMHSFLIGKEGKSVKELMDSTSTIIRIPKSDDPTNLINISGTSENIRVAIQKIQLLVDEKAKSDFVKLPIIKAFHALLAGFENSTVKRISEATGVRIHLPPYNVARDEVVVSGEKAGVARAVAELNSIYDVLRTTCGELPVPIEKAKHKFIRGPRGANVDEIFKTLGVHVEVPPTDSTETTVILRGPTARLAEALQKVYEYGNSMVSLTLKVPNWLHRHLVGPKGANIHKIHASHPKVRVNFGESDVVEIEGPTNDANEVNTILKKQVTELQARLTYVDIKGNPAHFRHLIGKGGSIINKIKADTGVQVNLPESDGVSDLIRVEGSPAGVAAAKATIEAILKKIADSKSVDVIIEQKYHSQLIGAKGANIREMIEQFGGISFNFPSSKEVSDIITLRGDKKNVDLAEKHLKNEVKRLIESNFTLEVSLFSQFLKFVIGKAGATLNQIKADTDTRIKIPKDAAETTVITITGTQKNCGLARDQILKIQSEQANIITETVEVDPKYHNAIIGSKGKVVKDIMAQCGGVNIIFPKEKGSSKISVRGDRADVEKAVASIKELANEKALNSFTLEFAAKKAFHRFIVGSKGSGLAKIKESGVRVIFPAAQDEDADVITLIGKEAACNAARDAILARIKELESIVEATIDVPSEHHRHFFYKSGQALKDLTDEFGVVINFPREGETVVVRGGAELVPQAVAKIGEIVADLKAQVTKTVVIASEHHGTLVGPAGKNVRQLSEQYNVNIKFPKSSSKKQRTENKDDKDNATTTWTPNSASTATTTAATDAPATSEEVIPVDHLASVDEIGNTTNAADTIIVKGKESDVDAAIAALTALIPETEEYEFPSEYHGNLIGPKGESIRKLMSEYDVNIKVPNSENHSNILTLKGVRAKIDAIKPVLAKRLAELDVDKADRELRSFKVVVEVDSKHHSSFIGKAGVVVQKLRDQFGVQFDFPKSDKAGNPVGDQNVITITGYEAKALAAKAYILEKVAQADALVTKEIEVDPRIHARIIGARGSGIQKLQEKFKVRINFPKNKDSATITIVGEGQDVEDAYEEIKALAEELGEVIAEREEYLKSKEAASAPSASAPAKQQAQQVPWSNDATFFPSLAAAASSKPLQGAWAGRR